MHYLKKLSIVFVCTCISLVSQINSPQSYEQNLSLFGNPTLIREYYYDRLSQLRGHYYNHYLNYDNEGKILKHIKTNKNLYDTIIPLFQNITPSVGITTYDFIYDSQNRLIEFHNKFVPDSGNVIHKDEDWVFDSYGMLIGRHFWSWENDDRILKNPSFEKVVHRNTNGQIEKIETNTFQFSLGGLGTSEIIEFKYNDDKKLDSIKVYLANSNGVLQLNETHTNLKILKNNLFNYDSLFFDSYKSFSPKGDTLYYDFKYDSHLRPLFNHKMKSDSSTIVKKEWIYKIDTTELIIHYLDGDKMMGKKIETVYDASGSYVTDQSYLEEGNEWVSEGSPLEIIQRTINDKRIVKATILLNDQDKDFYRLKADFEYEYGEITDLNESNFRSKILFYPNPAQNAIQIVDFEQSESIQIVKSDGAVWNLSAKEEINIDFLQTGLYLIKIVKNNGQVLNSKLVVKK